MKPLCSFYKINNLFINSLVLFWAAFGLGSCRQNIDEYAGLRLNQIQVIGTHNSYKMAIDSIILDTIRSINSLWSERFDYSHESIDEQLSIGLSNLELDIYVDNKGGKYAHPYFYTIFRKRGVIRPFDEEGLMEDHGFKVLHVQDIDFRSHCGTLKACLKQMKKWSDNNPRHRPIFVTINAKDNSREPLRTIPDKFTIDDFQKLDEQIVKELGKGKVLVPDDVRGDSETLEMAVLNKGWPFLEEVLGKFIFVLDETGEKREMYVNGHYSLRKRVLFVNSTAGSPEAAIMIINDPIKKQDQIRDLVSKGYIIRTRADADTYEARNNDKSRFNAASTSGAQIISTDYYRKSTHFESDYVVGFKNGEFFRKNPLLP